MFYVNIFFSPQVYGFVTAMLEILARSIISSHSLSTVLLSQWPKEQTPDITNSLHTKYSVFYKIEFTIYLVFYLPPPPIFAAVRPISLCLYFAFPLSLHLWLTVSLPQAFHCCMAQRQRFLKYRLSLKWKVDLCELRPGELNHQLKLQPSEGSEPILGKFTSI